MKTFYNVYAGVGDYSLGDYTTEKKAIAVAEQALKEEPDEEFIVQKWNKVDGQLEIDEGYNTITIKKD